MKDSTKRIITIDDETAVRRSLKAYLEDSGYEVLEAANGREGIELIESSSPDLVLCDLRMPEVDGLEVLHHVSREHPELPIIIVSGTGVIGDAIEAVRLGAWDYVLKPVEDMATLEHIVRMALERARLTKENRQYKEHLVEEVERQTSEIRDQARQLELINDALRQEIVEREKAEKIVRESGQRYRDLVENLQEGLGSVDLNEVFTFCNPAMAKIFELTPQDLIGRCLMEFLPEAEKQRVLEQARERSTGRSGIYTLEITTALGNTRFAIVHARPQYAPDGTYAGASALIQDVTEQKKLEQHLRQTQKMETIGTLAGGIAHDFNNILTPILGYAEMAIADWDDKDDRRDSIHQIITAAKRAKDLVKQILVFSRQTESSREPTEIHLIVREVVKFLQSTLPANIEVFENVDKSSGLVLADPTQIHQVVMNLCTNAFHAMEEAGGVLEVGLERFEVDTDTLQYCPDLRVGPHLRLTVSDNGCGMKKEIVEKIFEPFFTTKDIGKGTGLGLSLVHGIVSEHGGHISVYSEPGQGTTFHIYLPSVVNSEVRAVDNETVSLAGSERILFVDDEAPIANMAEKVLSRLGYRVTTFTNSLLALDAFTSKPQSFDVLITDINMPKLNGIELVEKVRAVRSDMPIILISGFSEKITEENCSSYGIRHFVMKPVLTRELAGAIRAAIDYAPIECGGDSSMRL